MTGSVLAVIFIPVAAAVGLAVWLISVMRVSNRPPKAEPRAEPRQDVLGGIFRGDPRQQVPSRDVPAGGRHTAEATASTAREEEQR